MSPHPKKPRSHTREAGAALAAAAPLATRWVERVLASHDPPFTVAQYLALRAIQHAPLSAAELARRTGVSGPAVSQLLSALEDEGLIQRQELESDRRTRGLALTSKGTQTLSSSTALVSYRLAELLVDLPRPEADALTRLLERVEAALSGAPPPRRSAARGGPAPPGPPAPRSRSA
jgi:DNA-binding MarR family transcriptional regulator